MSICRNVDMPKRRYVDMSICRNVDMSERRYVKTLICRNVDMSKRRYVVTSICRNVDMSERRYVDYMFRFSGSGVELASIMPSALCDGPKKYPLKKALCIISANTDCNSSRRRRDVTSEVVYQLADRTEPMDNYFKMLADIFGDERMYDLQERDWYSQFQMAVSDNSEGGMLIQSTEMTAILGMVKSQGSRSIVNIFLNRWNNTAGVWSNGTLDSISTSENIINMNQFRPRAEQYLIDTKNAADQGFDSIFDSFDHAYNVYKESEKTEKKDAGVCAKVRVRIVQELVLTREAFNAKLEIENGEFGRYSCDYRNTSNLWDRRTG
ncbi:hypothetical protein ScPMuIL_008741 [Solemya velum]